MDTKLIEKLYGLPDDALQGLSFSVPWQMSPEGDDSADGDRSSTSLISTNKEDSSYSREVLQTDCWNKFHRNPYINTSVRGIVGRATGMGFSVSSHILEIDDVLEEIELDPRNRMYTFWPKYVGRSLVEGELFLTLTCHTDGFIEVDFLESSSIVGGGTDNSGIIFHPNKTLMPLFYIVKDPKNGSIENDLIPSIFIARYPELIKIAKKNRHFTQKYADKNKNEKNKFKQFGGYFRFVVAYEKGFVTKRAISYLRTTLEWLNHYENLKKYEIDHKKSSGSYVWVFTIEDARTFKLWLSMSDSDRRKTGIMAKKTPGSSLILPPGITVDCKNPQLAKITDQDEDIKELVSSGLNEPYDIMTGSSKSPYGATAASRGPMSDRTSDEIAFLERFLRYDFWGSIFFLKNKVSGFKEFFKEKVASHFDDKQEPVFVYRKRRPEQLIDFEWPTSETINYEGRAKGLLGVKHGPVSETLGIPNEEIARRLGIGGSYRKKRLLLATEKDQLPELVYNLDAESLQEKAEAEPGKEKRNANTAKK
uniref:Portal protein n=1 Tax=viral metagenome TaxID=1070528 RepID=A0A6M3K7T1_9ZZZZ